MKLKINGTEVQQVLRATVNIGHGDSREPLKVPIAGMVVIVRLTEDTLLADWVKAKAGPDRFKKVELSTESRDEKTQHSWTIPHAWVSSYAENEWGSDVTAGGVGTDLQLTGSTITVNIMGALPGTVNYDGTNLINVSAGTAAEN